MQPEEKPKIKTEKLSPVKQLNRVLLRAIYLLSASMFLWLWYHFFPMSAVGQANTVIWSKPTNLSHSPQYSAHPAIETDNYGYVHVFWSEEVGGEPYDPENPGLGNSILYTRWDGVFWTLPVDIFFVSDEVVAENIAVDIDSESRLHVVWIGDSNFYYSNALSWQADSAHAWCKPVVIATDNARSRWETDIVADTTGKLHIVYATRGAEAGIYHIRSQDGGSNWGIATKLSKPLDRLETSFSNVKIITDDSGRLHTVWQTNQKEGYGQAVYYSRSTDGGESWSPPLQLKYREQGEVFVDWPYLTFKGGDELHLIYTNGSNQGRAYRISTDGGQTWDKPYDVITEMEGINGYVIPLVDGSGQMHLVVNMRTRTDQVVGIYYTQWLDGNWSPVIPVDISSQSALAAHYAAADVRLGNELHVVWTEINTSEIWHIYGKVPLAYQIPPLFVPSSELPTTSIVLPPTPIPTPLQSPISVPEPARKPETSDLSASTVSSLIPNPMVISLGTSLVLVVVVALWTRIRHQ